MAEPQNALRDAARLIRERAKAATHDNRDRWQLGKTLTSRSPVIVDDHDQPSVLIETWAPRYEDVNTHLTAIASPVVATAIADLLDTVADDMDFDGAHLAPRPYPDDPAYVVVVHDSGSVLPDWNAAYRLARTYLDNATAGDGK